MQEILLAARRFRRTLEGRPPPLISFAKFPTGACGDTCELLGQYFIDSGLGAWYYRVAFSPDCVSHAWLELDKIIVDITADQFTTREPLESVVVTDDRAWHDEHFPNQSPLRRYAGLAYWDGPALDRMIPAYEELRIAADAMPL